jgi:hypothetical protein
MVVTISKFRTVKVFSLTDKVKRLYIFRSKLPICLNNLFGSILKNSVAFERDYTVCFFTWHRSRRFQIVGSDHDHCKKEINQRILHSF